MLRELGISTVDAVARLATQFYLPTGLKSDLGIAAAERDDMPVLLLRLPTETIDQLFKNELDSARTIIRNRFAGIVINADFFVFSADTPAVTGLYLVIYLRFHLLFFFND